MYKIGQIFEGIYSPECALWCNENNAYIEEIEPVTKLVDDERLLVGFTYEKNGVDVTTGLYGTKQIKKTVRRFQIVAIP